MSCLIAAAMLASAALGASLVPARRAMRVAPLVALRAEWDKPGRPSGSSEDW